MRLDRYALAVWNARNRRCREEYYAHPVITEQRNHYYAGCEHCRDARRTA